MKTLSTAGFTVNEADAAGAVDAEGTVDAAGTVGTVEAVDAAGTAVNGVCGTETGDATAGTWSAVGVAGTGNAVGAACTGNAAGMANPGSAPAAGIWQRSFDLDSLNRLGEDCMIGYLGIRFTSFGPGFMEAEMAVDNRTRQPYGMLHGGASAVLAETLGSVAGNMCCSGDRCCLGLDITVSHLKGAFSGSVVRARAVPLHLGATTQVWRIVLFHPDRPAALIADARLTLAVRRRKQICRP